MFDLDGLAPTDSFDLYAMGLRPARCNGCAFAKLKYELGDRCFVLRYQRGVVVYELDAKPAPGQSEPLEHEGRPIRFRIMFMDISHSDECYNWQPPQ